MSEPSLPRSSPQDLLVEDEVALKLAHSHEQDHDHSHAHLHEHPHVHTEESIRRVVNRLARLEGHIRGIKAMVLEDRPCPDVLIQVAAVRGALDRVARMILDEHLTQCIARAAAAGNIEGEMEELKLALDRFLPRDKPSVKK